MCSMGNSIIYIQYQLLLKLELTKAKPLLHSKCFWFAFKLTEEAVDGQWAYLKISVSLSVIVMPLAFSILEWWGCFSVYSSVRMKLASQEISGERKTETEDHVRCIVLLWSIFSECNAEELKWAHISSEGGIQFDAAPESSSHLQVAQTSNSYSLRCASRHGDSKQYNPQVMFAELCP